MRSHISRSARRALQIAVLGGATLWLTACGYSKPEPAKLEEFRPSNKVSVVWQQRLDSMTPALTLALKGDTLAAVSADGKLALHKGVHPHWAEALARLAELAGAGKGPALSLFSPRHPATRVLQKCAEVSGGKFTLVDWLRPDGPARPGN